jgi:hypothetical protein
MRPRCLLNARPTTQFRNILEGIAWWSSFLVLVLWLAMHFTLIQLSNMPLSPLKLQYSDAIDRYVNPFFTQNWQLFAPQPIDEDLALMARGRFRDPHTGLAQTTPWLNVTEPLIDEVRKNRLTPMALVELAEANVVVDFKNQLPIDPRASFVRNGKRFQKSPLPADVDPRDMTALTRTGLAALEIAHPTLRFYQVQVGLSRYQFPRFTQRFRADAPDYSDITAVEWQPANWVAPYCCVPNAARSETVAR